MFEQEQDIIQSILEGQHNVLKQLDSQLPRTRWAPTTPQVLDYALVGQVQGKPVFTRVAVDLRARALWDPQINYNKNLYKIYEQFLLENEQSLAQSGDIQDTTELFAQWLDSRLEYQDVRRFLSFNPENRPLSLDSLEMQPDKITARVPVRRGTTTQEIEVPYSFNMYPGFYTNEQEYAQERNLLSNWLRNQNSFREAIENARKDIERGLPPHERDTQIAQRWGVRPNLDESAVIALRADNGWYVLPIDSLPFKPERKSEIESYIQQNREEYLNLARRMAQQNKKVFLTNESFKQQYIIDPKNARDTLVVARAKRGQNNNLQIQPLNASFLRIPHEVSPPPTKAFEKKDEKSASIGYVRKGDRWFPVILEGYQIKDKNEAEKWFNEKSKDYIRFYEYLGTYRPESLEGFSVYSHEDMRKAFGAGIDSKTVFIGGNAIRDNENKWKFVEEPVKTVDWSIRAQSIANRNLARNLRAFTTNQPSQEFFNKMKQNPVLSSHASQDGLKKIDGIARRILEGKTITAKEYEIFNEFAKVVEREGYRVSVPPSRGSLGSFGDVRMPTTQAQFTVPNQTFNALAGALEYKKLIDNPIPIQQFRNPDFYRREANPHVQGGWLTPKIKASTRFATRFVYESFDTKLESDAQSLIATHADLNKTIFNAYGIRKGYIPARAEIKKHNEEFIKRFGLEPVMKAIDEADSEEDIYRAIADWSRSNHRNDLITLRYLPDYQNQLSREFIGAARGTNFGRIMQFTRADTESEHAARSRVNFQLASFYAGITNHGIESLKTKDFLYYQNGRFVSGANNADRSNRKKFAERFNLREHQIALMRLPNNRYIVYDKANNKYYKAEPEVRESSYRSRHMPYPVEDTLYRLEPISPENAVGYTAEYLMRNVVPTSNPQERQKVVSSFIALDRLDRISEEINAERASKKQPLLSGNELMQEAFRRYEKRHGALPSEIKSDIQSVYHPYRQYTTGVRNLIDRSRASSFGAGHPVYEVFKFTHERETHNYSIRTALASRDDFYQDPIINRMLGLPSSIRSLAGYEERAKLLQEPVKKLADIERPTVLDVLNFAVDKTMQFAVGVLSIPEALLQGATGIFYDIPVGIDDAFSNLNERIATLVGKPTVQEAKRDAWEYGIDIYRETGAPVPLNLSFQPISFGEETGLMVSGRGAAYSPSGFGLWYMYPTGNTFNDFVRMTFESLISPGGVALTAGVSGIGALNSLGLRTTSGLSNAFARAKILKGVEKGIEVIQKPNRLKLFLEGFKTGFKKRPNLAKWERFQRISSFLEDTEDMMDFILMADPGMLGLSLASEYGAGAVRAAAMLLRDPVRLTRLVRNQSVVVGYISSNGDMRKGKVINYNPITAKFTIIDSESGAQLDVYDDKVYLPELDFIPSEVHTKEYQGEPVELIAGISDNPEEFLKIRDTHTTNGANLQDGRYTTELGGEKVSFTVENGQISNETKQRLIEELKKPERQDQIDIYAEDGTTPVANVPLLQLLQSRIKHEEKDSNRVEISTSDETFILERDGTGNFRFSSIFKGGGGEIQRQYDDFTSWQESLIRSAEKDEYKTGVKFFDENNTVIKEDKMLLKGRHSKDKIVVRNPRTEQYAIISKSDLKVQPKSLREIIAENQGETFLNAVYTLHLREILRDKLRTDIALTPESRLTNLRTLHKQSLETIKERIEKGRSKQLGDTPQIAAPLEIIETKDNEDNIIQRFVPLLEFDANNEVVRAPIVMGYSATTRQETAGVALGIVQFGNQPPLLAVAKIEKGRFVGYDFLDFTSGNYLLDMFVRDSAAEQALSNQLFGENLKNAYQQFISGRASVEVPTEESGQESSWQTTADVYTKLHLMFGAFINLIDAIRIRLGEEVDGQNARIVSEWIIFDENEWRLSEEAKESIREFDEDNADYHIAAIESVLNALASSLTNEENQQVDAIVSQYYDFLEETLYAGILSLLYPQLPHHTSRQSLGWIREFILYVRHFRQDETFGEELIKAIDAVSEDVRKTRSRLVQEITDIHQRFFKLLVDDINQSYEQKYTLAHPLIFFGSAFQGINLAQTLQQEHAKETVQEISQAQPEDIEKESVAGQIQEEIQQTLTTVESIEEELQATDATQEAIAEEETKGEIDEEQTELLQTAPTEPTPVPIESAETAEETQIDAEAQQAQTTTETTQTTLQTTQPIAEQPSDIRQTETITQPPQQTQAEPTQKPQRRTRQPRKQQREAEKQQRKTKRQQEPQRKPQPQKQQTKEQTKKQKEEKEEKQKTAETKPTQKEIKQETIQESTRKTKPEIKQEVKQEVKQEAKPAPQQKEEQPKTETKAKTEKQETKEKQVKEPKVEVIDEHATIAEGNQIFDTGEEIVFDDDFEMVVPEQREKQKIHITQKLKELAQEYTKFLTEYTSRLPTQDTTEATPETTRTKTAAAPKTEETTTQIPTVSRERETLLQEEYNEKVAEIFKPFEEKNKRT
ncbi:MAG: hypothetical protein KatS3mg087_1763 [Patescibacteria group bacterium]|nr:MAG: hypothetical protein KatS3mg087_1763 [Patescibacteria group bacterium]